MKKYYQVKKISIDFILNLIASLISVGVAQLVLYPALAHLMTSEKYGELLTLMGIANTIGVAVGGSLNNTRLIVQEKYEEGHQKGDFSLVLLLLLSLAAITSISVFTVVYKQSIIVTLLMTVFTILCLLRSYVSVEYRIFLNYKRILFSNVYVAVGNFLGIVFFALIKREDFWIIPFLFGEILSFIYTFRTTVVLREPIKRTSLFQDVISKETILLLSSISANVLTYLDRLLLLPLLGGVAVSCYTVASVFGKSLGILMAPMASVLLSYYAQKGFRMNRGLFWRVNLGTIFFGMFFALVSFFIAPFFTKILYGPLFAEAKEYLFIANITAIVNVVANMTQPAVLKFAPTFWQLIIQCIYCIVYLVGGIFAIRVCGLWGFAILALVASVIKIFMLYLLGSIFILGEKE